MESEKLYSKDDIKEPITLSEEQRDAVRGITLGIEEVDETVRSMAVEDVIKTIENNHPLNRLITDHNGEVIGYIACEDFVPHEAYIKYFGTTGGTGRSALAEIPAFLEYAKSEGYTKINFHGWNDRLNHILTRYGFTRVRTDKMLDFAVDFYEKELVEQKSNEDIEAERRKAFEQKYINKIQQDYEHILGTFGEDKKREKEKSINEAFQSLARRLTEKEDSDTNNADIEEKDKFEFGDRQKAILKLKLARYFQNKDTIDLSTIYDAIIESPKFINTDKGSFHRLLEVHELKTIQKIAELRKNRLEIAGTGDLMSNPWENLFQTTSGEYYVARLLNMPHLEEESAYMDHCVGTGDSYVNKIKRGEVEILSFRKKPRINPTTQRLEGDEPVITIEYNLKTKTIVQMKKYHDAYLTKEDPYFRDVVDALKKLRTSRTDTGELRDFKSISESELGISVQENHILTENGEVHFRDFDPDSGEFVLGRNISITEATPKSDIPKILRIVEDIRCIESEIAISLEEVSGQTKVYLGPWNPTIWRQLQNFPNIEHLYESFPDEKIFRYTLETDGSIDNPNKAKEALEAKGIYISEYGQDILQKTEFSHEGKTYNLVQFTVEQLGFPDGATTDEIYAKADELGLDLCPAEVGPLLRLSYTGTDWKFIAMKQITDRYGFPSVFDLGSGDAELELDGHRAKPGYRWHGHKEFVFVSRKTT